MDPRAGATSRPSRRSSRDPLQPPRAGIGPGDTPRVRGHARGVAPRSPAARSGRWRRSSAARSLHAFHPGGGLHHAMPARASGFCVYDDPALAIARARRDGLRVMYVDLDVHHGDGVQAIHWADPGVLTVSIHETGLSLFPGTGFADELGGGAARRARRSTSPLDPGTGRAGLAGGARARRCRRSPIAFRPRSIVSQHGADAHAFDPLAHLRVTTTAMGARRAPRRRAGPPARRRALARDGRRRLRRLPGRAPDVGAGLARAVPRGRPSASLARRVARALGRRRRALRPVADPARPSTTSRTPACRTGRRRTRPTAARPRSPHEVLEMALVALEPKAGEAAERPDRARAIGGAKEAAARCGARAVG